MELIDFDDSEGSFVLESTSGDAEDPERESLEEDLEPLEDPRERDPELELDEERECDLDRL